MAEDEDDEEEIEQKPVKKRKSSVVPVEEEKPKKKWIPGEAIKNMPKGVNRPQMSILWLSLGSLMSRVDQRFIEGQHKTSIQNQVSFEVA